MTIRPNPERPLFDQSEWRQPVPFVKTYEVRGMEFGPIPPVNGTVVRVRVGREIVVLTRDEARRVVEALTDLARL